MRHGRHLLNLVLQLRPEGYCVTVHRPAAPSAVYVGTAPHDGRPDPVRDPGPGPAQGHGALGPGGVHPAAQAPDADGVVGRVAEVHGAARGVGGVQGLDVLHGEGLAGAGEPAGGAAAAVAPVAEARGARGAREARGAPGAPGPGAVAVGSDDIELGDGARAAVHGGRTRSACALGRETEERPLQKKKSGKSKIHSQD